MSGQSANLTLKEAKAILNRTQCGENSQDGKNPGGGSMEIMKKQKGPQN